MIAQAEVSSDTPMFGRLVGKDLLPWIIVLANLIYGYATHTTTNEQTRQQATDDHIAIVDMRDKLGQLSGDQRALAAKIDMLITSQMRQRQ